MANQSERPKIMTEIRTAQNHLKEIERSLLFKNPNYQKPTMSKGPSFSNLNAPKEVVVLENPPGSTKFGKQLFYH